MPVPGATHDLVEFREAWFPTEFFLGFFRRCDQPGWIAGTPGFFDNWNFCTGNSFASLDDFAHRIAVTVAEVVEAVLAGFEGGDVGTGEVNNMDVVADAGAIWSRIICSVNFALAGLAERHFENVRN